MRIVFPTHLRQYEIDELIGAVEEGLRKALREDRPKNVRQFFALTNQQRRWEFNDLLGLLDDQSAAMEPKHDASPLHDRRRDRCYDQPRAKVCRRRTLAG
jgi:hypothetical protein